jgi:O-antigen ligase
MEWYQVNVDVMENEYSASPLSPIKEFLLYLYAVTNPFFVFSFIFNRDTLSLWILVLMIIIFLVEIVSSGGRFWTDSSFIPLALFFLAFLIGTLRIYFEEPGNTWMGKTPFDRATAIDLRFLLAIVSFFICVNFLANAPRRVFLSILKIQLVIGMFIIFIALLQYGAFALSGRTDFLKFEPTNESYFGRSNIFRFGRYKVFRSSSIFNEPSFLGFFLIPLLMKTILFWGQQISASSRFWVGCILSFVVLGIFSNLSFTAVFSIVILFGIFIAVAWFGPYRKIILLVLIIFTLFSIIIAFLPYSNVLLDRLGRVFALRDGSTLDRLFRVYTSFMVFLDYPLFGVGPGGYAFFYPRMGGMDPTLMATPLNMWLHFLTDVGIIGVIPFFIFLGMILKQAFTATKREPLVAVFLWSIVSYLILLTTLDFWFLEMFWFELAILLCLTKNKWAQAPIMHNTDNKVFA